MLRDCECCFFSANLAEDVQLAATLTPDGPVQLIIDFVTPQNQPFSVAPSLPLSPTFRSNHPLSAVSDQEVSSQAPSSPGLVRLSVTVSQRDVSCSAEALITVTDSLDAAVGPSLFNARGLPGYTFERAAGELWRSRFDAERNLIVVNNGHRDFVFATRSRTIQLRYLVRLYVKELVLKNFRGLPAERLMERA